MVSKGLMAVMVGVMMMVVVAEARVIRRGGDVAASKTRLADRKKWQHVPELVREFLLREKQHLKDGDKSDDVTEDQAQGNNDVNAPAQEEKLNNDEDPPETANHDDPPSTRKRRNANYYNYRNDDSDEDDSDDSDEDDSDDSDDSDEDDDDDDDDWGRRRWYGEVYRGGYRGSYPHGGHHHGRLSSGYGGYPGRVGYGGGGARYGNGPGYYNRHNDNDDDDDGRYPYGNLVNRPDVNSPYIYGQGGNSDDTSRVIISDGGYDYGYDNARDGYGHGGGRGRNHHGGGGGGYGSRHQRPRW